jgi:type II secretory pathway component PulJ
LDIDGARVAVDARHVGLHDLLVACAISGFVLAATYTVLEQGLRSHSVGSARAESQQSARAALARLSVEIRNAGRGARWTAPAIEVAEPSRIVLASDLDDDGTTLDRGERITWQLVGSILRRNAGAGAQPVANGVRAFELRYFDAAGRPTTDPLEVRTVEVVLVTVPDGPESGLARGVATRMTTRVRLRNR